ncbi:hypothetical protein F4860DRAFT_528817 [Xylaria cubensis]|nr:hypothetical protein F4860DRAFT_528817 [Xylaria cubensis]
MIWNQWTYMVGNAIKTKMCEADSSSDGSSSDSDDASSSGSSSITDYDSSNGDSSADDDDDESDDADEEEALPSKDSSSSQLFAYGFFMGSLCIIFSFAFVSYGPKEWTVSLMSSTATIGPFSVVRTVLRFLFLVIYIPVVNRLAFIDWEWRVVAAAVIAYITLVETWKAGKRRLFYRSSKLAVNGSTSLYKIDDYVPLARRPADTMVMIPLGALLASQARRRPAHRNRRMAWLARIDHDLRIISSRLEAVNRTLDRLLEMDRS